MRGFYLISRLFLTIIFMLLLLAVFHNFVFGSINEGSFPFASYAGDTGIQIYNEDGEKTGRFNIAAFYQDVLKASGKPEVLEDCAQSTSFAECVEENSDERMEQQYEQKMNGIRNYVEIAEQHGMELTSSGFIRDLIS